MEYKYILNYALIVVFPEEAVTKISIQLEKNQKDLPAFDVVENLVEEEVHNYTYTALYIQHNALHTPLQRPPY